MQAFLSERSFGTNEWVRSLNQCLLKYRTSIHSSTKRRPVDLFFSFNAHGFLPGRSRSTKQSFRDNILSQVKNKIQMDKKAENRVFQPGETVLVRNLSGPKFGPKGDLAKVIKQIDFHSAEVQLVEGGRGFRCSTSRLSRVPDSDSDDCDSVSCSSVRSDPQSPPSTLESSHGAVPDNNPSPTPGRPKRSCGPPQFYGERYFF